MGITIAFMVMTMASGMESRMQSDLRIFTGSVSASTETVAVEIPVAPYLIFEPTS